ncbi:tRNA pseudouridine(55) synthase TruB [Candidatus Dojkabacteria bacterium]|nr:tRNA pseudouridine(55) synthase TruB [Candidatus Dojkabacteria bacterium]
MINIKSFLNKIEIDEFNRVNVVLAINKRKGITSHDLVDEVRQKLNTRKVGHAGALDPFATGVMLILVGKFTRLSNELVSSEKEYKARILFGISTNTQDSEGEITQRKDIQVTEREVIKALKSFEGGYEQYVPVFSSVKIDGNKLRKMARRALSFTIEENKGQKSVVFKMAEGDIEVNLPKKKVEIKKLELKSFGKQKLSGYEFAKNLTDEYLYCEINAAVSKGTYMRQFAEDLGEKLEIPGMLLELERRRVGEIGLSDCISLEKLTFDKPDDN